jgi:hypothetical protein
MMLAKLSGRLMRTQISSSPVSLQESSRTVVRAFIEAGLWALVSITILLWIVLRRFGDVLLTLVPLLLARRRDWASSHVRLLGQRQRPASCSRMCRWMEGGWADVLRNCQPGPSGHSVAWVRGRGRSASRPWPRSSGKLPGPYASR